ncbi:MAG: hypothetical protein ABJP34_09860 [Erythrobacter sp.]
MIRFTLGSNAKLFVIFVAASAMGCIPALGHNAATEGEENAPPAVDTYLDAMCTLAGDWKGEFLQYKDDAVSRVSEMEVGFQCQPGNDVLMETNIFRQDDEGSPFSTLKVIFSAGKGVENNPADGKALSSDDSDDQKSRMQMSYFYGGIEKIYFYEAVSVTYDNALNWKAVRESTEAVHATDKMPPVSRYTHIRNEKGLTMIREVKSGSGPDDWTLSSKLILRHQS